MLVDTISEINNIPRDDFFKLLSSEQLDTYTASLRGLSETQARVVLSSTNLDKVQKQQILNKLAETNATITLTSAEATEALTRKLGSKEAANNLLIKSGLVTKEQIETGVKITLNKKMLEQAMLSGKITEEEYKQFIAATGLTGGNVGLATSFKLLTLQIWENIKAMVAWMVSNPFGQIMLGATLLMGAVGIIDLLTTSVEEHREQLSDLKSEYSEIKSELDGVNSELESTQSKIKDLENKGTLTFTEAEELENLRKQNNELKRQNDLLEMQEKIKAKEVNNKFVETMEADAGKIEYASGNTKMEETRGGRTYEVDVTDITEKEHAFNQIEELSKLYVEKEKATTEEQIKAIDQRIETVNKYLQDKNKEWLEDAEGIEYIQNPTTKDDEKVNEWLDYINDFQDKMAIAMGGDNAKENAFNRLIDNWKFDEVVQGLQDLGKEGKVTADMLRNPAYDAFIQKLIDIGFISDDTEGSLRFIANAFNGVGGSASLSAAKTSEAISAIIADLDNEAKACGTTNEEFGKLIGQHVLFGNTSLKTQDKIIAIKALEDALGDCSDEMKYLLSLFNAAAGAYSTKNPHVLTDGDRTGSAELELARMFGTFNKVNIPKTTNLRTTNSGTTKDKTDSSKDSTPSYEDPTEAIINRINLRADELAQQEEEIQNLIEIAELENDYEKQISLTNDLIAKRKDRVEELNKANAGLHNEAEYLRNSNPYDEGSWFDSQGNATEAYYDDFNLASKEEQERIKGLFENLSKYKKAYADNTKEISNINKEILQDEESIWDARQQIFDERLEESEYYIEHSNDFGWENGDNEVKARRRVLGWIQSEYYRSLIKDDEEYYKILEENRLKYHEALKEDATKVLELNASRISSFKTLLESYHDVTNNVAEAQHEINKELEASKTMYEYLDEDTRKLLFNQEDYNILSDELIDIRAEAEKLQRRYNNDILTATEENLEQITSQYEMQYEMLMKSYEIAKAELEVAKKRQQLDNVLNERKVRMFVDGQWQWVANTQDVINAQSELADAEYARQQAKNSAKQTEAINELTETENEINTALNKIDAGLINFNDGLISLSNTSIPTLRGIIDETGAALRNFAYSLSNSGYNVSSRLDSSRTVTAISSTGKYISVDQHYASGTNNTKSGWVELGEKKPEMLINNNGHLIPINQPTIGNIGAGGIVFNQDQMDFARKIWDWSNVGSLGHNNLINRSIPQTIEKTIDNRIIINGMTVDTGSQNGRDLVNALKRYTATH